MRAIVALGSNIEPRQAYLDRAYAALQALPRVRLVAKSSVFETDPVGAPPEYAAQKFLNAAAIFEVGMPVEKFAEEMHRIEAQLGRVRTVKNGPRTIDLDLIDFGGKVIDTPELTLPHPRAVERDFVKKPLAEIGVNLAETVILAAGDFPRVDSLAWLTLIAAKRVVCCDSAADTYRQKRHKEPDLVVGDMDSIRGTFEQAMWVQGDDTNDLEKAIAACRQHGWQDCVVLGATGKREDHTISNIFRALDAGVPIVTDNGCFVPIEKSAAFQLPLDTGVSIFATKWGTRMRSEGLRWPLRGVRFNSIYRATLNRTCEERITLKTNKRVYFYISAI